VSNRMGMRTFLFSLLSFLFVMSGLAVADVGVKTTHPRIWITPTRLTRMQNYRTLNTARWQRVVTAANAADPMAEALMYAVAGDTAKGDAAISWALTTAVPSNHVSGDVYYGYRSVIPQVTAVYDWCYARMNTAQRQQIATWLMDRADEIWYETNGGSHHWSDSNPSNNYFYGFLTVWDAALAVKGDGTDTTTSGTPSCPDRPNYHINLALNKYYNLVRPYTDGWGAGGVMAESSNYDSTQRLAEILDGHLTATNPTQDLINESGFTFLNDSLLWRVHSTVPGLDLHYPYGDESRISIGPLSDYDRERALVAREDSGIAARKEYVKYWLDTINPNYSHWDWQQAWEFIFYDENATATDYTAVLSPWYFAPGPGFMVRRSNWTTDATYWGIWAGPLQESHQNCEVNAFLIYKAGWLAGNATIWSHSGILNSTPNCNTYMLGTYGQTQQTPDATWPQEAGHVVKQENNSEYGFFSGWGAAAYVQDRSHGGFSIANDFTRQIAHVTAADLFVVYDRITLASGYTTLAKNSHLHCEYSPTVNGRTYKFDNGTYRLWGQSLLPGSGVSITSDSIVDGSTTSYEVVVSTNNSQATDYMLNVLQLAPVAQGSVTTPVAVQATSGNAEGAQVGNWVLMFGKTDLVSGTVSYTLSSASTSHLVFDLNTGTSYTITRKDGSGNTLGTSTVATNANGTLRFDNPDGNARQFVLTAGAPDTTPPSAPGNLSLTAVSSSQINASWTAATDNVGVAGYKITVDTHSDFSAPIAGYNNKDLGNVLSTSVTGLSASTLYYVKVVAYDAAQNVGPGATGSATTQAPAALSISTSSLPNGTVSTAYSQTLTATGGQSPYTWSIQAGNLPAGLSLAGSTGVISGIPTATGTSNFTVKATDSLSATATKALSIVVSAAPLSITTSSLPSGQTGVSYSQTLAATGGITPYSWAIASGSLPAGLSLVAGTGAITGTPTTSGTSSFTARVTDNASTTATKALSIIVSATGGTTYYVATTGLDTNPGSSSQPWLTLQHAVDSIAAGDTVIVRDGTYYGCRIDTNSGTSGSPKTIKAEHHAGAILNHPGASNDHNSVFEIEDSNYWVVEDFRVNAMTSYDHAIDARNAGHITVRNCEGHSSTLTGIFSGFTDYLLVEGCEAHETTEHGIYPGNSADYGTVRGNISWGNTECGIQLNADLSMGGDGTMSYWTIEKNTLYGNGISGGAGINFDGVADSKILNTLLYNNGRNGIALYAIDGANGSTRNILYNDTILNPSGSLWCITIAQASQGAACADNKIKNCILMNDSAARGSIIGYSSSMGSGFQSDYNAVIDRFSVDQDNETLLTLAQWRGYGYDTHSFITTKTALFVDPANNDYHLKVGSPAINAGTTVTEVTDDIEGTSRPQGGAYDVGCYEAAGGSALTITTSSLPAGTVGTAYNQTLTATGGTAPYTWAISSGTLPSGLSLSTSTGAITGTPTAAGTSNFTARVTDNVAATATKALSIVVNATTLSITTSSLPNGMVGSAYSQTLTATGGVTPYTWSLQSGSVPAGLSLTSGGVISGTPTASGTSSFTAKVTDNASATATKALSIVVDPSAPAGGEYHTASSDTVSTTTSTDWQTKTTLTFTPTASDTWLVFAFAEYSRSATDYWTAVQLQIDGVTEGTQSMRSDQSASDYYVFATTKVTTLSAASHTMTISYATQGAASTASIRRARIVAIRKESLEIFSNAYDADINPGNTLSDMVSLTFTPSAAGDYLLIWNAESMGQFSNKTYLKSRLNGANVDEGQIYGRVDSCYDAFTSFAVATLPASAQTMTLSAMKDGTGSNNVRRSRVAAVRLSGGRFSTYASTADDTQSSTASTSFVQKVSKNWTSGPQGNWLVLGSARMSETITSQLFEAQTQYNDGTVLANIARTNMGTDEWKNYACIAVQSISAGGRQVDTDYRSASASYSANIKYAHEVMLPLDGGTTPLSITTSSLPADTVGVAYNQTLAATGGTTPYTWSIQSGSLPAGLSLVAGTGAITGTPTAAGTSNFTAKVTDNVAATATQALSIVINAAVSITTSSLPADTINVGYNQALAATGGTGSLTWSLNAGSLPTGLSLTSGGAITGTPTAAGTSSVTVKATDTVTASATKALSIVVNAAVSITTSSLPADTVGIAYNQTMAATGGTGALTWSISSGSLPAGLSLVAGTGAITGTPTSAGTSNFTAMATDTLGANGTKALSIVVNAAVSITTSSLSADTVNIAYNQTLSATGGTGALTWSLNAGSLPTGLSLTSGGSITGTPTAAGTSNFTVKATDTLTASATKALSIVVNAAPTITTSSLPADTVNIAYNQTLAATGGTSPLSWAISSGSLPTGLTIVAGTGAITGTPTAAGTSNFTVRVTDNVGATATQALSIVVNAAPSITTSSLPNGNVGAAYNQTMAASGGTTPLTWSISSGSLPTGLSLVAASGAITGTPTASGTSNFTARVTDNVGATATKALSIVVTSTLTITTSSLPATTVGATYNQTLAATGGVTPYTWAISSGSLPAGLSLVAGTGAITGTPTAAGTSNFTARVTDNVSATATQALSIVVNAAVTITTSSLPADTVGIAYNQTMAATGGTGALTWSISSGSLPAGLSLVAASGAITGTPTTAATSNFTAMATDTVGATGSKALSIVVNAAVSITTSSLPADTINIAYSQTLAATGGTGALTWSLNAGSLPTGLSLTSGGVISGTPTATGTSNFTVKATDTLTASATKALSIVVNAAPSITTSSLPTTTVGASYNQTLAATGGTTPYTWAISSGSLPAGLSIVAGTGAITGTPTASGTSSFTARVTDNVGSTATKALSIVVNAAVTITTASLPADTINIAYNQTLAATGGTGALTWSIQSGSLPTGLSLNASTGAITGTPTAAGTSNFTAKATDTVSASATKALSIVINAAPSITTSSLPAGAIGTAYNQTLVATGGTAPLTWAIASGNLPAGLTLVASTGAITGTPTASGTSSFTARVTDNVSATATKALSIAITAGGPYTYYVSTTGSDTTGDGSSGNPWATIQKGVDTIANGDTIIVTNGNYAGFRVRYSGASGAVKTVKAQNALGAVITSAGTLCTTPSFIEVKNDTPASGESYWVVDGFETTGSANYGVEMQYGDHVTIKNTKVHNSALACLSMQHSNYCTLNSDEVYSPTSGSGFFMGNSGDNNTVVNCSAHNCPSNGLFVTSDDAVGDMTCSGWTFEKNTSYSNAKAMSADGMTGSMIRNNLGYGQNKGLFLMGFESATTSNNNRILNNTFVCTAGGTFCFYIHKYTAGLPEGTNNNVLNNVLYNYDTTSTRGSICIDTAAETGFQSDYNVVMNYFGLDDGATMDTLAQWRALGFDTHSIQAADTALFVNPGSNDYHLKTGSPAINAGTTLADCTDDKEGVSRPQGGAYDIGCYEVVPGAEPAYQFAASDSEATTTSTNYTNKAALSFTPGVSDTWVIMGFAELKNSSTSRSTSAQITIDGAVAQDTMLAPKNNTDYQSFTGMKVVTLSAAAHTINIDYKTSNTSGTAYIRYARIVAIRQASLLVNSADEGDTGHDVTTTMTDYVTTSFTPATAGDYLLIWSTAMNGNTTSYNTNIEARLNGTAQDTCSVRNSTTTNYVTFLSVQMANLAASAQTISLAAAKDSGSSATHHVKRSRVTAIRLSGSRFAGYQSNAANTESTTTSTTFQNKLTQSWTPAAAGNWLVLTSFRMTNSSTSYSTEGQVTVDDSTTSAQPLKRIQATTDYLPMGSVDVRNLTAAAHHMDVNYRSASTSGTAKIKYVRFVGLPL